MRGTWPLANTSLQLTRLVRGKSGGDRRAGVSQRKSTVVGAGGQLSSRPLANDVELLLTP